MVDLTRFKDLFFAVYIDGETTLLDVNEYVARMIVATANMTWR